MGFWDTSDGENAVSDKTEYEVGGNVDPIPDDSTVLAFISEAKWRDLEDTGERYLELKWTIEQPEEYARRNVFHKLWVLDLDPKAKDETKALAKRDKARRMLAAIDANCGGKLGRKDGIPTEDDMVIAFSGKTMTIKVKVWEMNGGSGNWVAAVGPKSKPLIVGKGAPPKATGTAKDAVGDDEIPF